MQMMNMLFDGVVINGHLEVAKWLIEFGCKKILLLLIFMYIMNMLNGL